MKLKRKSILFLLCGVVAVLGCVFIAALWPIVVGSGRSPSSTVSNLVYEDAIREVDRIYAEIGSTDSDGQSFFPSQPIPPALQVAKPRGMRITAEGIYLKTREAFVEEDGIFILRDGADFSPGTSGDPSFRRFKDRIYLYHISG